MNLDLSESRVLLVDDTRADLDVLVSTLQTAYRISVARSGEEALRTTQRFMPDLVVCDILMPGMDGLEVCRVLGSDSKTKDIPVILISSLNLPEQRIAGFANGAVDYVCKPFDAYEVKARVRAHLQIKKMRDQLIEVAGSAKGANSAHLKIAVTVAEQLAKPVDRMIALIPQLTAEPDPAKVRASLNAALEDLRRSKCLCDRMLAAARGSTGANPPAAGAV